jgi:hypothetical protein
MRPPVAVPVRPGRSISRLAVLVVIVCACSNGGRERDRAAITPAYDQAGKLKELAYDSNHNGVADTWTDMDGARAVQTRIDSNEDGRLDRWEYYDEKSNLVKIGFSRSDDGKANAWAFAGPDGGIERIEMSSAADDTKVDRWERHDGNGIVAAEEDTDLDGSADKWETYESARLKTAAFDENADGKPDRRLTYTNGLLVTIESDPDAAGRFTRVLEVKPPPAPLPLPRPE